MSINGFLQPHQGIPSTKNYQARNGSKAPLGYTTGLGRDLLMAFVIANSTDSHGNTALINAIQADSMEIAWMLIENGADLNAQNPNGLTALHYAACRGDQELVRLLLTSGADSNFLNADYETPLICAAKNGYHRIIPLLMQFGADPRICDLHGKGPLAWAIAHNHIHVVESMLRSSARFGYSIVNDSLFHLAASLNQGEICHLLLEAKLQRTNPNNGKRLSKF